MNTKTKLLSLGLCFGLSVAGYSQSTIEQRIENAPTLKVGEAGEKINKNELSQPQQKAYLTENNNEELKSITAKESYEFNNNQQFLQSNKLLTNELRELKASHDKLNQPVLDKASYLKAKEKFDLATANYENALNKLVNGNYKENIKKAAQSELNNLK